jgi:MFS family permease
MNYRLLFAILSTAFVEQVVITVIRVTTTYRAVELDLSVIWIGIITAVYAVLPIAIGVPMGRLIDRGYDAITVWVGGVLLVIAAAGFVVFPNLAGILVFTAIAGTAHLLFVVGQQVLCTRCGTGPGAMERAIGNYMVANAVGQGVGPYLVGLAGGSASVPPTHFLFIVGAAGAVLAAVCAFLTPSVGAHKLPAGRDKPPLRELLFMPGLTTIILVSVVTVVAQDLIVVYLPLLGAERGFTVGAVGTLLAVRAAAFSVRALPAHRDQHVLQRRELCAGGAAAADAAALRGDRGGGLCAQRRHHRQHRRRAGDGERRRDRHREFAAHHGQPCRPVHHPDSGQPDRHHVRHRRHFRHHWGHARRLRCRGAIRQAARQSG